MNINQGPSHRALPPAPQTNIEGDVPLLEDLGDDSSIQDSSETHAPQVRADNGADNNNQQPSNEPDKSTKAPESAEDELDLPADVRESLDSLKPKEPLKSEAAKPDPKAEVKPEEPAKAEVQTGRDYTNVDPEVVSVLKQLRNGAYNSFKDQIPLWHKAFKERETMPKYIAQHPDAYKLDKGYQELEVSVRNAEFETSTLYDNLMALEGKEPFNLLTGYDDKGKPTYVKVDPSKGIDPRLKFEITEAYRRASDTQRNLTKEYEGYNLRYKDKIQQERAFIETPSRKSSRTLIPKNSRPKRLSMPLFWKRLFLTVSLQPMQGVLHTTP